MFYTLIENNATLLEAQHLVRFEKSPIRAYLAQQVSHEDIREDWYWLEELSGKSQRVFQEQLESAKNKLRSFIGSRIVQRIIGQQANILNFREIMDKGYILLVNLSEQNTISPVVADVWRFACERARYRRQIPP